MLRTARHWIMSYVYINSTAEGSWVLSTVTEIVYSLRAFFRAPPIVCVCVFPLDDLAKFLFLISLKLGFQKSRMKLLILVFLGAGLSENTVETL
jgi:hypothetical protein